MKKYIRWVTDRGELHEWYLDEWRQEYFIKSPEDYRIMCYALSDAEFAATDEHFEESEVKLGDRGITIGHFSWNAFESRTPLQSIQIDLAGLEQFSLDLASELPELLELIKLMDEQTIQKFRCALVSNAQQIKLWENLSIETIGPVVYRKYIQNKCRSYSTL